MYVADKIIRLLLTAAVLHLTDSVFHERSRVILKPAVDINRFSEFGFAVAYQPGVKRLVVGAPRADLLGKLYSCDLNNIDLTELECKEDMIDVTRDKTISRLNNPNQNFMMGASISATSKFYTTCAPLWTAGEVRKKSKNPEENMYGTCFFVFPDGTTTRYRGIFEKYMQVKRNKPYKFAITSGTGWSLLIDEKNDLLLVVKTSSTVDFTYAPYSSQPNPRSWLTSLIMEQMKMIIADGTLPVKAKSILETNGIWKSWNVGFAVTAGNFFSDETVYAFSMLLHTMKGAIGFFRYINKKVQIITDDGKDWMNPYTVPEISMSVTSMFGVALASVDLNLDGKADLLVGAPAHSDLECTECGALHIYVGDTMESMRNESRIWSIINDVELSRFGSAIIARDLNGDAKAEVIASAPYENSGRGVVYVFDGMEVYEALTDMTSHKKVMVSDMRFTRRLEGEDHWRLGFSLQFVADADENGCDELAAGAPGSNRVILYRCIQSINVTMTTRLVEDFVTIENTTFTVEVCAWVQYPKASTEIHGDLVVSNSISGQGVSFSDADTSQTQTYDLSTKRDKYCSTVILKLTDHEPQNYTFTTQATLPAGSSTPTVFLSRSHCVLTDSRDISRYCEGNTKCTPRLLMNLTWSGENPYLIGSSDIETMSLRVWNEGDTTYEACVKVHLRGAKVARIDGCSREDIGRFYEFYYKNPSMSKVETEKWHCELPKPIKTNTWVLFNLVFNMTKVTNMENELYILTTINEKCNQDNDLTDDHNTTVIKYDLNTESIVLKALTSTVHVSDTKIMDSTYSINSIQEYLITNNGSVTWKNITAELIISNQHFIESVKVSVTPLFAGKCERLDELNIKGGDNIVYHCKLDLPSNKTQKIVTTQIVTKTDIEKYLPKNVKAQLYITSLLTIYLKPTKDVKFESINTTIIYHKEQIWLNKSWLLVLIGVVLAIFVLAIIAFILYKSGFFKRKQKERLKSFRESVRRQSSRQRFLTLSSPENDQNQGLSNEEVGDDCAFEDPPATDNKRDVKKKGRGRAKQD